MAKADIHLARADSRRAMSLAATDSPFTIEVRFLGGLSDAQKKAFSTAADRWAQVIVGDLPSVMINGEVIDDVVIDAQGTSIDGPGGILGQAGPTHLRPESAGSAALLPARGIMSFDTADLAHMEREGTLNDVITHEMGHVLLFGTGWDLKGMLKGIGTENPGFTGKAAVKEYRALLSDGRRPTRVPVENTGGQGTRDAHWRESIFHHELMSGFIAQPGNPLSRLTVASMQDMGYQVDLEAAESYDLPDLFSLAEEGSLVPHAAPVDGGRVLPVIPFVLPPESIKAAKGKG